MGEAAGLLPSTSSKKHGKAPPRCPSTEGLGPRDKAHTSGLGPAVCPYKETPQVNRTWGWKRPFCPFQIPDISEQGSKNKLEGKALDSTVGFSLCLRTFQTPESS